MSLRYQILDWDRHYENSKSRERDVLTWCPVPNKQDGLGYGRLLSEPDGPALYGAFVAVVLVASKQRRPRHGHLTGNGRSDGAPYSADDLSVKTRIGRDVIARMLEITCSASVGWIAAYDASARQVPAECPPTARQVPANDPPAALEGKGMEGMEGKIHTHTAREGWMGMVDQIRQARPEYGKMREDDILNAIRPAFGKADALSAAVAEWAADHSNATKPYDSPLRSLRKMVEAVMEGAPAKPAARYRGKEVTA